MNNNKKLHNIDQSFKQNLYLAFKDFTESFIYWRIFCMIGINDIRKRYTRSKLGQFWLTLSLAINICALGFIWSHLFKMPASTYVPYLATGTIFWTFISSSINEGAMVYISSAAYLKELNIPRISYINSLFVRNFIVLLHNLPVLIPVYFICSISISPADILVALAGLILTILFLFPAIIVVGLLSLRFRDFPNIIISLMQIVFYVTPVLWKVESISEKVHQYMIFNPFAVFLSLCRDSMTEKVIADEYWLAAFIYIALGWVVATVIFSKFRSRIIYWV